ncbi:MAG: WecB/TagA/CpsF family glycosyltransferase [Oligoflexia bacterium]|nr:WecB/TagA/CpsF family glycosyltransferase [Oligoflexia bacterium]
MPYKVEKIFDLNFAKASQAELREFVLSLGHQKNMGSSIIFANAHVVVESDYDPEFKNTLQKASVLIADGKPLSWLLGTQRYSGPDFMSDFLEQAKDKRHFFIGSTQEVLNALSLKFKHLQIKTYSPPYEKTFSEQEKQRQIEMIKTFNADFIWVGLGAPKQEKYVVEMSTLCQTGVWLAVGAAFDFLSGNKPRAPKLLQDMGAEWVYRLITEPRRLGMRYLKTNPAFIALSLKELTQRRRNG